MGDSGGSDPPAAAMSTSRRAASEAGRSKRGACDSGTLPVRVATLLGVGQCWRRGDDAGVSRQAKGLEALGAPAQLNSRALQLRESSSRPSAISKFSTGCAARTAMKSGSTATVVELAIKLGLVATVIGWALGSW